MSFATPEVSSTMHASTGAEHYVSTCSPVELKELAGTFKINAVKGSNTCGEMTEQVKRATDIGQQHVFSGTVKNSTEVQYPMGCQLPTSMEKQFLQHGRMSLVALAYMIQCVALAASLDNCIH